MILIYGGAYQGKRKFVEKTFGFSEEDYFICDTHTLPDLSKKVLVGYEQWVLGQIRREENPTAWLLAHIGEMEHLVIVLEDMSCGVVPIEAEQRKWLREVGGCGLLLSEKSEKTYRLFCGIATQLK